MPSYYEGWGRTRHEAARVRLAPTSGDPPTREIRWPGQARARRTHDQLRTAHTSDIRGKWVAPLPARRPRLRSHRPRLGHLLILLASRLSGHHKPCLPALSFCLRHCNGFEMDDDTV